VSGLARLGLSLMSPALRIYRTKHREITITTIFRIVFLLALAVWVSVVGLPV